MQKILSRKSRIFETLHVPFHRRRVIYFGSEQGNRVTDRLHLQRGRSEADGLLNGAPSGCRRAAGFSRLSGWDHFKCYMECHQTINLWHVLQSRGGNTVGGGAFTSNVWGVGSLGTRRCAQTRCAGVARNGVARCSPASLLRIWLGSPYKLPTFRRQAFILLHNVRVEFAHFTSLHNCFEYG